MTDDSNPYSSSSFNQGEGSKAASASTPAPEPSNQAYYTPTAQLHESYAPTTNQPYYNYSTWQGNWSNAGAYTYSNSYQTPQSQAPFIPYQPQQTYGPTPQQNYASTSQAPYTSSHNANPQYVPTPAPAAKSRPKLHARPRTPSPSPPPPETYKHWDELILGFLKNLKLTQAAAGFEADMLVMNADWERKKVPDALKELTKNILLLGTSKSTKEEESSPPEQPLEERKLNYVRLANNAPPRSQTAINKSISTFLAQNRKRNDLSNRAEFVYTLAEKRQRLGDPTADIPSCARVDAKPVNRDVQMKYDIAKNEEGPLSRTVHTVEGTEGKGKGKEMGSSGGAQLPGTDGTLAERLPGFDERLQNIETHLAVRYVPSLPRTFLDRLHFLEAHIIRLEKEYPPWAALHFNQPNRGWPPPPRLTPIIVPPQMRSVAKDKPPEDGALPAVDVSRSTKFKKSSLHRAVLEKLEVQQAMSDLAGGSGR
ncbi:hypothetical protein Hypma_002455 [Hypsizygus marmoreus]|uniref:Uncharacterized protein n=1 Tax=Hypsizygus marmoreus TaxID=39966 RepID=A0A369JAF3_HYPMA|nr:hypothetical protein Hypma_002455 [Hypsizygus marmoreus]